MQLKKNGCFAPLTPDTKIWQFFSNESKKINKNQLGFVAKAQYIPLQ